MIQDFLNKKILTKILIFFWILSAFYSYFFIPPKSDDGGIYLISALSVFNNGIPGVLLQDKIIPTFFVFPTQPFINGIFLKIISFFGFDLNSYNYRILNLISFICLIIITSKIINLLLNDHKYKYLLNSIFLILISITPISNNFYINRPELMGFFLIFLAFYYILLSKKNIPSKKDNYIKISILLGLSFIFHPSSMLLSTAIYSIFLFYGLAKKNLKKKIVSIFFFIMSISPLFVWMIINYDVVFDQLFNRISSDISSNKNIIGTIFFDNLKILLNIKKENTFQYLYNFIFNFPLFLILIFCSILNLILIFNKKLRVNYKSYEFSFFIISIIIILFAKPAPPYSLTISFFLTFNLIILISKFKFEFMNNKKINFILSFFLIFLLITPLNPIFFHKIKNYITDDYYSLERTRDFYKSIITSNDILVVNNTLLPIFINEMSDEIKKKRLRKKLYHFYPVMYEPSEKFLELYELDINELLKNDHENLIWGVSKERINKINKNDYCFLSTSQTSLRLNNVEKIFEDRYHYILKARKIINKNCN